MADPIVATPKPRRRLRKVLGVVGIVISLLVVALFVYGNAPNTFEDIPEVVSAEARERNTLIATALAVGGIEDAFVDVTPEHAFVSYELPNGTRSGSDQGQRLQELVLGATAQGAPASERAIIVQNENGTMRLTWEVDIATVLGFLAGEITEETLRAAIQETTG